MTKSAKKPPFRSGAMLERARTKIEQVTEASAAKAHRAADAALSGSSDFEGEDPILVFLRMVHGIESLIRLDMQLADEMAALVATMPAVESTHRH
jgi:hypothetical protein